MRRVMLAFLFPVVLSACGDRPTPMVPDPVSMAIGPTTPSLSSAAPIIRHFPGDSPGPVWYAQLGRGFIPNDGIWAGIVFLRSLACVPAGFNLLDQFDIPAAWGCELMVEGEDWWHDLAVPPPFQRRDRGLGAVPVYFVLWSEIQAATADDILTIGELQNLPSLLVGTASLAE